MELTFFIVARMVLWFGFVAKSVGHTSVLLLWLNSASTVSRLSFLPTLPPWQVMLGGNTARTADPN